MDHRELFDQRNHIVVKDNDLVRARYNLTVNQQKIIAYIISLIKPEDKEMKMYEISISDYCELCGIEKDYFYQDIKDKNLFHVTLVSKKTKDCEDTSNNLELNMDAKEREKLELVMISHPDIRYSQVM